MILSGACLPADEKCPAGATNVIESRVERALELRSIIQEDVSAAKALGGTYGPN
jgi:hypothetical protein